MNEPGMIYSVVDKDRIIISPDDNKKSQKVTFFLLALNTDRIRKTVFYITYNYFISFSE